MFILTYFGSSDGSNNGIPTPKFTFIPDFTSFANLFVILYFALSVSVNSTVEVGSGFMGYFSIIFFENMLFRSCL